MPASAASYLSMRRQQCPLFWRVLPLLILLLAWLLFTWTLGDRSLWVDEFVTTKMVSGGVLDAVRGAAADVHPPLYFALLNVWSQAAGTSDFAFRMLSAMTAMLAVAVMLPFSRRLWPASTPGWRLVAMLMLAGAPALVLFGRMSRYYSLVLLLSMLSTWALMAVLNRKPRAWLVYVVSTVAMLYTFMPSIVLLLVHAVPALASPRRRAWLTAVALVMVLFLPWLAFVALGQMAMVQSFIATPFSRSGLGVALGLVASLYTFSVGDTLYPWSPFAILGLLAVAATAITALAKGGWPARRLGLMLVAGVAGIAMIVNLLAVGTPFLHVPARGLFLLPFLVLLCVMGLQGIKCVSARIGIAGLLALAWVASLSNIFAGAQFMNPIYLTPSKEAATWVRSHMQPGDLVIADWEAAFDRYFTSAADADARHIDSADTEAIRAALQQHAPARVWWVALGRDSKQIAALADTRAVLMQQYSLAADVCLSPIDPLYKQFKDLALRRESYDCRLAVERFDRAVP